MKAKHSEGEVGRKKPIGLLPQLCESRIGLQGWADRAGRPRLPPPTLNIPQLLAEEEEEALIRQKTTQSWIYLSPLCSKAPQLA